VTDRSQLSIRSRAPRATSSAVRRVMLANLPGKSRLEVEFQNALSALGLRYRKDCSPIPGLRCRPDVVLPHSRVAIFIHGCFWHGCPEHFRTPKANAEWWSEKIKATADRDARQSESLRSNGWLVLTVWEHEFRTVGATRIAERIARQARPLKPQRHGQTQSKEL
jgi:DNA mismatch endonuclease, patch repair protein